MTTTGSVLVTGASRGIGAATVTALVQRGFHVWATVRSDADAQRVASAHGPAVTVRRCDVTVAAEVEALGAEVVSQGRLVGLVDNAGTAVPAPLEHLPLDQLRHQLEVNLVGQLAVIQAALPALRTTRGRIIVVGSIADRLALPMLGAYHASKFGLLGLSDTLRAELAPSGVRVVLVEPGAVATSIWETGRLLGEELLAEAPPEASRRYGAQIARIRADAERSAARGLPPSAVAAVIARALTARNPRPRYLVGRDAKVAAVVAKLPFRLRYRVTAARS
ncbi:SDR family NAD(P)-dependent oxidoreductase [Oryzobacter sp. R7]|uniref:SDR family NAD(P)-dependent oxidoreductase n=1 Tax=Oryzobacter faecalis TaxID=3388656 RepID=UPI00398D4C26